MMNIVPPVMNDKVRALLRLAESSHSRNEAFNCYELADKIVIKYDLDPEMFEPKKEDRQCK
jgi:hypothetical protein